MEPETVPPECEQRAAEEVCRSIYKEVAELYDSKQLEINGEKLGFRILYGPPAIHAEYLFVGYQPGGGPESLCVDQHRAWPVECEYAFDKCGLAAAKYENTRLVTAMQKIWGVATLERCTGLNAIFFRASSIQSWKRGVPRKLRLELEEVSKCWAKKVVTALKPQRLVIVGLGTFDRLTTGSVEVRGRRVLVKRGELWGSPAFGTLHLSGAWVSQAETDRIKIYFDELSSNRNWQT